MTRSMALFAGLIAAQGAFAQSTFGGPVQFYFSTPGGDNSRLTHVLVDSANWTGEFDVVVKNTGTSTIQFLFGTLQYGFGRTFGYGVTSPPVPGSDLIRERYAFPPFQFVRDNPNITWRPSWSPGNDQTWLGGGWYDPIAGPERAWGLRYEVDQELGAPLLALAPNETMALIRIAVRDNGLFNRGGSADVIMHRWPLASLGTTALLRPTGPGADAVYYYDPGDFELNSRITFVTPEPSSLFALCLAGTVLLMKKRRRWE